MAAPPEDAAASRPRSDARDTSARPWAALAPSLAAVIEPELQALAEEIIAAIAHTIPEYSRPMEGAFGAGVRAAIEEALRHFVALFGSADGPPPGDRPVYRALGRGELRAGRSLDALQAAYRLGARISWRRVSAAVRDAGADTDTLALLAESIFAYIDSISAASVDGYAAAQAEMAGERERRRERLVRMLVGELPSEPRELEEAAEAATVSLPAMVAALVTRDPDFQRLATRAGTGAIAGPVRELTCLIVPDPDGPGRRAQLQAALANHGGALGPSVSLAAAPSSFALALAALRLQDRGVLAEGELILADQCLDTLVLFGDGEAGLLLAERALAPLAPLPPRTRARLEATLFAWLRQQGRVPASARELNVHSQTVRYRLARLAELFGASLEDPDKRFELEMALRLRARSGA